MIIEVLKEIGFKFEVDYDSIVGIVNNKYFVVMVLNWVVGIYIDVILVFKFVYKGKRLVLNLNLIWVFFKYKKFFWFSCLNINLRKNLLYGSFFGYVSVCLFVGSIMVIFNMGGDEGNIIFIISSLCMVI